MVYPFPSSYIKKKKEDYLPRGMTGKKHSEASKLQMGITKKIRYKDGTIKPWNKGYSAFKGEYHSPIKNVNGKGVQMDRFVWCRANNIHRVPENCEIHHLDFNPSNNKIENLQLLERKYHRGFHAKVTKHLIAEGNLI